jgi:hypothetical protein
VPIDIGGEVNRPVFVVPYLTNYSWDAVHMLSILVNTTDLSEKGRAQMVGELLNSRPATQNMNGIDYREFAWHLSIGINDPLKL